MAIRLVVKSASDLPKLDRFSKIDPYCELTFHEEKQSTSMISNDQSPEWNESFKWTLEVTPETTEVIDVLLLDHETLGKNRAVCKGCIPLAGAMEHGSSSLDVALTNPEGEPLDSKLHVDLSYRAPVSEALKGEVGALKIRVEELEGQLKTLQVTATQTETELQETKEQVEPLKTENTEAKATIVQLQDELSTAKAGDLAAQNESLRQEITALKQRIEELEGQQSRQPAAVVQPASGESGEREQQPLIHEGEGGEERRKGCCTCCTLL